MRTATSEELAAADWRAIGTSIRIVVTDPAALSRARTILEDDLAALDLACSRFRADSELRRLDASDERPTPVSPLLAEAIATALAAAALSEGDVDLTVGTTISEIGYDDDFAAVPVDGPGCAWCPHRRPAGSRSSSTAQPAP